jgi:hypothetical protein
MEEITVSKTKYRLIKIALIVVSIILLIVIIDFFASLKYYALLNNLGFYQDSKYANHSCAILGDTSGTESYSTWTICCENYSDDCFMRIYSCVNVNNPDSCKFFELNIATSGKKLLEQYKIIEKEIKKLKNE